MMLIDGAPRLSLTKKKERRIRNNLNKKKKRKVKKRVRFDMIQRTCVRSFPKVSSRDVENVWHSNLDYNFFVLNWKYYPHEPMEPRSFLDTLWQIKNTPETMRMEDFQCFQPQEQPKRTKIRETFLQACASTSSSTTLESLASLSIAMTTEHKRQAQICGALNEQEVQDYLHSSHEENNSSQATKSLQDQQADAMTFLSDYVDSILHRTASLVGV